ncbi:MAG: class I SAM-dependent methyltransferase [Desulfobacteraceae bacterium]|nr:MAG: class I SAM-dependent methyltransferase [Desulfobacteraceae bacterium]
MRYEDNRRSIKYFVKQYIIRNADVLKGKTIIDFPAGNGITSRILREHGAVPYPFDLFPEYFEIDGLNCRRANIADGIPLDSKFADGLICQEGIEHFSDQFGALKEFNRLLKPGGLLLITTPNYSNIRAKLSYLLSESERAPSMMPPNELDSIWMNRQDITDDFYFGHVYLIGIQKLRALARLSGFALKKVHYTRGKTTSVILFPLLYPFMFLANLISYSKNMRKNKDYDRKTKQAVYREMFRLSINPAVLVTGNLMVEFIKETDYNEVGKHLKGRHKEFGVT